MTCGVLGALASPALAAGPKWLSQTQLSSTAPVSDVQVAMDNQGDTLAAWIDAAGAVDFSFRPAGGGNGFSGGGITGTGVAPSHLHLAMDQAGDAVAVWEENGNTVWTASFLSGTFGFPQSVAGSASNPATSPDVAIYNENGSGFALNAEIVWLDNDSGSHEVVQAAYFPLSGSPGTVENLTSDTAPNAHNAANPQVVLDSAGNAIAAWQQSDGTHTQVWSEVKPGGPSGGFGGPSLASQLSSAATNAADVRLGSDRFDGNLPNAGGVTAVWDDSAGNVDADYMPLGNTNWNDPQTGVGSGKLPAVAMDSLGNAVAVWQQSGLIKAAALEAGGSQQFGSAVQISATGDSSSAPQIGADGNGETIAVWRDATVNKIDAAVENSFSLTPSFAAGAGISTAGNAPANPAVALDNFGDAAAAWQQGPTAQPQVAGYDNGPQFPNLQIPSTPYAGHAVTFSADVTDVWSTVSASGYSWAFGDGASATGNPVSHTYATTGADTVTLTVTDDADVAAPTQSQSLTVGTQPAPVPGGLFQLDSPNDCFTGASWGCGTVNTSDPTSSAYQPAVSPDGKNVYLASLDNSVTEFSRNASTGALTYMGCFSAGGASGGCSEPNGGANGLANPAGVAVSPDGTSVYVIGQGDDAVVSFTRDTTTGALTWQGCIGESSDGPACPNGTGVGLDFPYGIAVSPDGKNVYVSSDGGGGELASFDRAPDGRLTQTEAPNNCFEGLAEGPCTQANGMANAIGVAVSPDGKNVYVEAGGTSAAGDIVEFSRDATADSLTQLGCVGANESCGGANDIDGTEDMAISPDGLFAYVNSSQNDSVVELSRDPSTGALSQIGCVGSGSGCTSANGLIEPLGVAISPDGANVYASGAAINSEVAFARGRARGLLTQLASPFDCITSYSGVCGQGGAAGLVGARRVVVSPDGKNVYVAGQGSGAVAVLGRVVSTDVAVGVDAPANATQGASFAYTFTVTNHGPASVADPTLSFSLSSLLTGSTAVPSQGSCSGDTCHLGPLAAGASATVQVPVSAASTGTATTTASVSPSGDVIDPDLSNNSVSSTTAITSPPPSSLPPPTVAQTVNAYPVAGTVFVKLPGTNKFIPLSQARQLPMGTIIDARHGTVELVFAKKGGGTMEGQFFDGEFTFTQKNNYAVDVTLVGGGFGSSTGKHSTRHGPLAVIARGRPHRSLWSNVHGNFTTSGRSASGSARGTEWFTRDTLAGTLIHVTRDKVLVINFKTHKKILVTAPHKIFIKG